MRKSANSRVHDWLTVELRNAREREEKEPLTGRVTVRLYGDQCTRLEKIAAALGMSRNGCAEDMMHQAIEDAWEVYFEQLDPVDQELTSRELQEEEEAYDGLPDTVRSDV